MDEVHLDAICYTPFWNHSATWNSTEPSFTPCFSDTALSWLPAAFLWLNVPYLVYEDIISKRKPIKANRFNYLKGLIIFIAGLISVVQIVYLSILKSRNDSKRISIAEIISACISLSSNALLLVLIHLQRRSGFINGGAIWFYFLLKIICTAFAIPTYLIHDNHKDLIQLIIIFITLGIEIILLLICSFADETPRVESKRIHKICPKETASFTSKLTFWWYNKLIFKGFRKPLVNEDLWAIRNHDRSSTIFGHFNRYWRHRAFIKNPEADNLIKNEAFRNASFKSEITEYFSNGEAAVADRAEKAKFQLNPKTNVVVILLRQFGKYFILPCAARFVTDLVNLANPIVMKYLIAFTADYSAPAWHGLFYSAIFVATNISSSLTSAYQQHRMAVLGMRIRTCLMGAIYRKSLLLASHSKKNYTTGEIVNLCAVDSQRFIDLLPWICFLWTAPVQIAIAIWLLWQELGIAVLGGLLLMILFIPINGWAMSFVKKIQTKQMALKDKRLKATNEMLNGIKVLKLYAWEEAFIANIQEIRQQELRYIRMGGYVTTIFNLISYTSPFMVTCLTFTIYIFFGKEGNTLTAEKAFVSVALFNMLRVPMAQIPNMATSLMLVLVALKRLNKFLNSAETANYVERKQDKSNAVEMKNASFSWELAADTSSATLSNLNVTIPKGSLVAVVGSVGSGKSSFLCALLGEMQKVSGSVNISGDLKLAYVAQQAWIQNNTVRENIVFGRKYSPDRYNKVIEACALKPDLAMLQAGDATEIGEKGINLSGGQKQRVSIARACYSQANCVLFDDPLSAVDSHVGKHIFDQVLDSRTGLLRNKTRILVTNALYMLSNVDQIIMLKNGSIEAIGTYDNLLRTSPVFFELISNYTNTNMAPDQPEESTIIEEDDHLVETLHNETPAMLRTFSMTSAVTVSNLERHNSVTSSVKAKPKSNFEELKAKSKLVEAEKMESGQVTLAVYKKFFASLGFFWSILIVFNYLMMVVSSYGANFWLSFWTDNPNADANRSLLVYFLIGATQFIFVISGWMSIIQGTMRASTNLHWHLLDSIVHAPMWFYDTTPLGRIVNRFSKDMDIIDTAMALLIRILCNHTFNVLATLATVSVQTPLFLAIVIPFVCVYAFVQRFYVATTRQLKRLESVSRSPIFTWFSETISGVSTIKAYGATERFIEESDNRVDRNTQSFYPNAVANCWLQVRLEFMACFLTFFASLFAVISKKSSPDEEGGLSGGGIGLSLSYALNVTLALNMCVRMYAELENNIISVERISEYTNVEPEAPWYKDADEKLPEEQSSQRHPIAALLISRGASQK